MKNMLFYLVFVFIAAVPGQTEFKNDNVSICVNIQSSVYTYRIANLSSKPIVGFEIKQHAGHGFKVPQGWQTKVSSDSFKTWTNTPSSAIYPNHAADLSFNVSTKGAVLGFSKAKILLQSGETITIPDVWASSPEPKTYIALVAGVILLILLLHTAILVGKKLSR